MVIFSSGPHSFFNCIAKIVSSSDKPLSSKHCISITTVYDRVDFTTSFLLQLSQSFHVSDVQLLIKVYINVHFWATLSQRLQRLLDYAC